jgi:alkanesulfonate monooxygenase SsuD/methylene tetrahydromethanopterin reductase-like flavin-dependent oxidoreductase (luciferase family)
VGPDKGGGMKFGIFYEHQLPRPWEDGDEQRLIQDALEQIETADRLGFQYVWEVEHHFLEEYSHSSAPEVFLAAASQRTRNIRLGHGIIQTAPGYNHPARTAERVAMLDLVSGGRVEFGSGESSSEAEMGGFGIDMTTKREQWLEGLEVAIRCMTETPFGGHEGTYLSMPPRNVVPKPVQRPHPPLWVACSRRDTILLAAEKGIGGLSFAFIDPEEAQKWMSDYESTLTERCVPVGKAVNPQVACVTPMMVHHDETEALRRGIEGANFFGYSLAHYYVFGTHTPARTNVWDEFVERRNQLGYSPEAALAQQNETLGAKIAAGDNTGLRGAVGTPDQVREFLRRYEQAGVDQIIFVLQAGTNRHEHIMESLELFGTQILPEFAERDPAQTAAREERFAPLIEAAFERKRELGLDAVPQMPDDYEMKAIPKAMIDMAENEMGQQILEKIADEGAVGETTTMSSMLS